MHLRSSPQFPSFEAIGDDGEGGVGAITDSGKYFQ